jgi:polyphosphate kinase
MTEFRCELLSADQLGVLASGPLPPGIAAGEARRSLHRDLYLDTADDSLRRRGVTCRLRLDAKGGAALTLRIAGGEASGGDTRVDSRVAAGDVSAAMAADTAVSKRVRGIVDPSLLEVRVDLEVDRLTRRASLDWFRRPRLSVHLDRVTVRRNGTSARFFQMCAHQLRGDASDLLLLERALEEDHGVRRSAVPTHERAELAIKWARLEDVPRGAGYSDRFLRAPIPVSGVDGGGPEFFNAELSLLAFQHRVLSLVASDATPLGERLRFLSIVGANVDEFFMVRMAGLIAATRDEPAERRDDGLSPGAEVAAVSEAAASIAVRQAECFEQCRRAMESLGARVVTWEVLSDADRAVLADRFRDDIQPLLTPFAMTLSPGHPLPRLGHLTLSMAVILRQRAGGPPRFAELELPSSLPRFLSVSPSRDERTIVPIEEVIRGNLGLLYPDTTVEHAYAFRVTRSAEIELDEEHADDLLEEVARATTARGQGIAVRVEVERGMPAIVRALLLENVRREQAAVGAPPLPDVDEVDGLLDLRGLIHLDLPARAKATYPPFTAGRPFGDAGVFSTLGARDVLAHHPFDSFGETVVRFLRDAAADPDVAAIKITLYRIGTPSAIADALLSAAKAGKSVTVFVELKARFDEEINVGWARALEAAGGHVVRGIVGFKNHAKVALVVRREREGSALRRYVHIATGNYNTRSGEQYTDLSLFTTNDQIADDVADLFNELTGGSAAPRRAKQALLVAPQHLLPAIVEQIDREAAHARAGRPAGITAKVNGLSDPDVVRALYRASNDGVEIDLVVRGICTLRPGIPARSERVRVRSIVGRFLEHSRIYRFANGGSPRYFIGSADLRPRNLRRRVEVLVPIDDTDQRRRLDEILALYLDDPTAWELRSDGSYEPRGGADGSAQETLIARQRAAT